MTDRDVHESLPNIFEDLGLPDAATHMLKAQIVAELYRLATDGAIADAEVAYRLGITEKRVARLFRGDFRRYAVEELMAFLTAFGRDIEIVARQHDTEAHGTITFRAA